MKKISIFITLFVIVIAGNAQFSPTKLGTNLGTVSNNNAVLEVAGNNSILLPRVNLTNTTSFSPLSQFTDGMMLYNKQAINDVVAGPYICFNTKWNRFTNKISPSLPLDNLGLTTTSNPLYTTAIYQVYNASSGLILSNDAIANSSFMFNVDAVVNNDGSGNYPSTPNNFLGKLAFNSYLFNGFSNVQAYFDPFNLNWRVYKNASAFDIGNESNYNYLINFNATNSKATNPFINYRFPSYNQTLTTDKIFIKNGVIQREGSVGITNTSDLGLYSCGSGNWLRFGTNQAPIKFFSDLATNGESGTNWNMTIESNGNVGIGNNFTPSNKLDVQGTIRSVSGGLFSELDTATGPFFNLNNSLKTTTGVKQNWRIRNAYNSQATSSNGLFFSSYDGSNQNAYDHLFLSDNGNVGIGTSNPQYTLDVSGTIIAQNTGGSDYITKGFLVLISNSKTQANTAKKWVFNNSNVLNYNAILFSATTSDNNFSATYPFNIEDSGRISIGNSTLSTYNSQLTVVGSQTQTVSNYGYLNSNQTSIKGYVNATQNNIGYSIWADYRIAGGEFNAFSDARIKNIKGKSNGKNDLKILKQIEITDYTKKDSISDASVYKKVIAQQVEKVYPQAVHQTKGFIPNVYKSAQATDGQINLITDLKPGDRIKLIVGTGDLEVKVTQVTNDFFKVDKPINEKVFVFGKEVDDFRNVDYEAIAMLNVSATQEIANRIRKVDNQLIELDTKNKVLFKRKDELLKKIKDLLTK